MVGIVDRSASPYEIAKSAIEDATYMCARTHGEAPDVTIHGRLDLDMATIPNYVQYILVELLKNSMRATVEFHGVDNHLPPIKVIIADGENNEDVVSAIPACVPACLPACIIIITTFIRVCGHVIMYLFSALIMLLGDQGV
jgi:hypothetical protein